MNMENEHFLINLFSKKVKGQFYIIGALIIILFMFNARYSSRMSMEEPIDTSKNVFSNAKGEYFKALDASYASNPTSKNMEDNMTSFLDFLNNVSISHGQKLEAIAIAMIPRGSKYNVSVWNFMGESVNVTIVLGGAPQTISLSNKAAGRLVFNGTTDFIMATLNYTKASGANSVSHFNITNRKLNAFIEIKMKTSKTAWADALSNAEELTL